MRTPVKVAPASIPPKALEPKSVPIRIGATIATNPGKTISTSAARVEISIQPFVSGFAVPSSNPSISLNWRRTSATILKAALPTADMVKSAIKNGIVPPTKSPITTIGSNRLSTLRSTVLQ